VLHFTRSVGRHISCTFGFRRFLSHRHIGKLAARINQHEHRLICNLLLDLEKSLVAVKEFIKVARKTISLICETEEVEHWIEVAPFSHGWYKSEVSMFCDSIRSNQ
jgi:hypothetical protein